MSAQDFTAVLLDRDGELSAETRLPFAPYPGLIVNPEWSTEYLAIVQVYWTGSAFECYCEAMDGGDSPATSWRVADRRTAGFLAERWTEYVMTMQTVGISEARCADVLRRLERES